MLRQLMDLFFKLHQRESNSLNLLIGETAAVHTAYCLSFENLPQELDQRQHQLREPLLDTFRVHVYPLGQRATYVLQLTTECFEVFGRQRCRAARGR